MTILELLRLHPPRRMARLNRNHLRFILCFDISNVAFFPSLFNKVYISLLDEE